jgi:two-component system cell cycle response regulator
VATQAEILNGKILVVDDQEKAARAVVEMLRDAGYRNVTFCTQAASVKDLHQKQRFDLILLDLQMPGKSGFQVIEDLRTIENEDSYLPVLALTAEPAYRVHALKAGAKDFISKPFDLEEALTRIRNMLEVRLLHDEVRRNAKAMETLALHDALTGLANRRLLTDRISAALANARRNETTMAVIFLDLDGFKQINDTLGHSVGDALLKLVGGRLQAVVREEDTVGRLGGDEFVIALWNVAHFEDVISVTSKLIESVSKPYLIEGHAVTVTTSAGVGIYPAHGSDTDTLMKRADNALYAAKRSGKNAYRIAGDSHRTNTRGGPRPAVS